jgi:Amt family ammonium transporter
MSVLAVRGLRALALSIVLSVWVGGVTAKGVAGEPPAASSTQAELAATKDAATEKAVTPPPDDYFTGKSGLDPTGAKAGVTATPAGDGKGDVPANLSNTDLFHRIAHNLFSINMVWVLIAGFLVMFMQAGFAMVEVGLCRAKNAAHTVAMNFMIYPLGCIAFWVYGFAIGWGNYINGPVPEAWVSTLGPGIAALDSGIGIEPAVDEATKEPTGAYKYGLLGTKGFFLDGLDDVSIMALFFFMMVFMDTTATIPTGAMAERWSWKNFCLYGLWVALPYCLFANWVWGGGWLAQAGLNWKLGHGAVDFAGSGVVHAMGGVIGLAGALAIGARLGKYNRDGKPAPMPGHHVPMVVIGTFILAFGWFGFNPGSTLAGTDLRISVVVVNTMLASVAGALACMVTLQLKGLKPDPTMMCNGMLAGLVAITAPCAFVDSWAAVAIGGIAGVIVVFSVFFWERRGVDDPVGAISVHGVNGLWGLISLGIFANGKYGAGWNGVSRPEMISGVAKDLGYDGVRGLLYGDASQLYAQLLDAAVVAVFGFVMAYAWFKLSNLITPLRVSKETEIEGLDSPEMGAIGYPDFTVGKRG